MTDAERTQFIARTPPPPVAMRRTDYPEPEEDDSRRTGLIWAAVVVALLLVIGAAAYAIVFLGNDKGPETVAVPSNLVGQTATAASNAITQAGLVPQKGEDVSGDCDDGQQGKDGLVCTVSPKEGIKVKKGSTVTYHLYTPARTQVPFVQNLQLSEAEAKLHDAQLSWQIHNVNRSDPAGTVVKQNPAAFETVAPGTKVDLYVSTGKLKLPDVTGLTFGDAQAKLNPGFTNIVQGTPIPTTDPSKDGIVAQQSPTAGKAYPPDTQITLVLYTYVPPSTSASTSPSTSGSTSASASSSPP